MVCSVKIKFSPTAVELALSSSEEDEFDPSQARALDMGRQRAEDDDYISKEMFQLELAKLKSKYERGK